MCTKYLKIDHFCVLFLIEIHLIIIGKPLIHFINLVECHALETVIVLVVEP